MEGARLLLILRVVLLDTRSAQTLIGVKRRRAKPEATTESLSMSNMFTDDRRFIVIYTVYADGKVKLSE